MAATKAAIYVRVSTTNQEEEGTSLASQERLCREFATDHEWEVVRVFQDVYTASEYRERPGLSGMRELVRLKAVDIVLCYALDRLSRNQTHVAVLMDELEHHGVQLSLVTEEFENTATGKFLQSARAFAAELEREKIKERQIRGKRERALSGKLHRAGVDPFGYVRVPGSQGEIVREVVETEAVVVREMYDRIVAGQSLRHVTAWLNEQGIPSPAVRRNIKTRDTAIWGKSQVRRILTNPMYKGEAYAWRHRAGKRGSNVNRPQEEWIRLPDGIVPAIVEPAVWAAVQERLASNSGATTRNQKNPYLLRGMIFCANCGARMWSDREKDYRTYRCSSRQLRSGPCGGSRVRADEIEADVWSQAVALLTEPNAIKREMARQRSNSRQPVDISKRRALERALERLDKRKALLTRQFQRTEDENAWDLIMTDLSRIEDERSAITGQLEELDVETSRRRENQHQVQELETLRERAGENIHQFDFDQKRHTLEAALKARVYADGKEWSVEWGI